MLFEAKLIIYNAPLTYVYPNTIKTCLRADHLLFGRQLIYSSNITSTVVTNLTVLSSTTDKINRNSNHLHETQQTSKLNINFPKINVNNIVLGYDEKVL